MMPLAAVWVYTRIVVCCVKMSQKITDSCLGCAEVELLLFIGCAISMHFSGMKIVRGGSGTAHRLKCTFLGYQLTLCLDFSKQSGN